MNTTVAGTTAKTFGAKVEEYRERLDMQQKQLAKRCGLSPPHLNRIEKGTRKRPHLEAVLRMIEALRLTRTEAEELVDVAGLSPIVLQNINYDEDGRASGLVKIAKRETPSGIQPAIGKPTQKALSGGALYNTPTLSINERETLIHRLAILEQKLQAAEKNLGDADEEIRALQALADQAQPLSFAERLYLQIAGPAGYVQSFFDEVAAGNHHDLKVASWPKEDSNIFATQVYGYEARLYGTVEFTAHVTEKLAYDYVKSLIENKFPQSRIEVKVPENVDPI